MPLNVNDVFGEYQIGDIVQHFNSSSGGSGLKIGLAPSYGNLNTASIKTMDDNLKILIGSTVRTIAAIPKEQRTWDNLMQAMMRNPLITTISGSNVARSDILRRLADNVLQNHTYIHEVHTWFLQLVPDDEVQRNTQIKIDFIADLFGLHQMLAAPIMEKGLSLVDIGVMRFPDIDRPFFQASRMYKIRLAMAHVSAFNILQGSYDSIKFAPNADTIKNLTSTVHKQAVKDGEGVFGDFEDPEPEPAKAPVEMFQYNNPEQGRDDLYSILHGGMPENAARIVAAKADAAKAEEQKREDQYQQSRDDMYTILHGGLPRPRD